MKFWDITGQVFWFGILTTPLFSFLIIRKIKSTTIAKIALFILITLVLSVIFYLLAFSIIFRNGLGPDSVY